MYFKASKQDWTYPSTCNQIWFFLQTFCSFSKSSTWPRCGEPAKTKHTQINTVVHSWLLRIFQGDTDYRIRQWHYNLEFLENACHISNIWPLQIFPTRLMTAWSLKNKMCLWNTTVWLKIQKSYFDSEGHKVIDLCMAWSGFIGGVTNIQSSSPTAQSQG